MLITVNNTPIFIYSAGKPLRPELPTILFLHGAANDHSVWTWQSRWFAHHGFNALAVDLPGHGRSGGTAASSIEEAADWVLKLITALDLPPVHLAGHSMGSLIALEAASRSTDRIAKLALLGCALPMTVSDALLDAALNNEQQAIALINGWSHAPATLLSGGPIPGFWLPGVNRALMGRAKKGILHRDLLNCQEYAAGIAAAQRVRCPTLLLIGERDLMTPKKSTLELRKNLVDARESMIDGAGHAMMNERHEAVLESLRCFF